MEDKDKQEKRKRRLREPNTHRETEEALRRSRDELEERTAELVKKNRYESVISAITRSVHQSLDLQEVFENTADVMSKNISEAGCITIFMVEGNEAVLKACRGCPDWFVERVRRIPYPRGATWNTIIEGKLTYCADVEKDTVIGPAGRELGIQSHISMPVHSGGKTAGCINVMSFKKNAFDKDEQRLIETLSQEIGIAVGNAQQAEALRRSEEQYRNLFERVPTGVYRTTSDGRILMANPALIRMLGYSSFYELALHNLEENNEFYPDYPRSVFKETLERQEEVKGLESAWKKYDGSIIHVSENARVVRAEDGAVLYYEGTVEDITKHKQMDNDLRESLIQLSKKNRYEIIVNAVTRSVHQSINLQDVMENAVDTLSRNIDRVGSVSFYLVEREELVVKAYRGYSNRYIERAGRIPYPRGTAWKTVIEENTRYCADTDQDTTLGPAGREEGIKSYVSTPIRFEGKVLGTLNIASSEKNAFDEEELKLLEMVAQQVETAFNNAKQAEALRQAKEELELRVNERTKELAEINEELKKELAWHKWAEKTLKGSEERYRALYDENPTMYFTVTREGKVLSVNKFVTENLCYNNYEVVGQSLFNIIYEDDRKEASERLNECFLNPERIYKCEIRKVHKNGNAIWMRESARAMETPDGNMVALLVCEDITERKKSEEEIKTSLREKEILLREIHHRVKNNLQIISSLLNLQSKYIPGKEAREKFRESQNRVRSMALIHEKLYGSDNLTGINFSDYIKTLSKHLIHFYGSDMVVLNTEINDIVINLDKAIPCGLIVNEIVSNSLKHAFPTRKEGEIYIKLSSDDGINTLIIGNNGVEFPQNLNFQNTDSLGLQLVCALVDQLKGTIELDRSGGTEFKIRFSGGGGLKAKFDTR